MKSNQHFVKDAVVAVVVQDHNVIFHDFLKRLSHFEIAFFNFSQRRRGQGDKGAWR